VADLDGDGVADLLSGSWPGEIFFFKGLGKGDFAPPAKLKDRDGKSLNLGGGFQADESGEWFTVAGDAKYETGDKGQKVIVYEGQRYEVPAGKRGGITGTASAVHAFDWDADGDFDLIVGDIRGRVWIVPNEGTAKAWAFGKERPIGIPDGSMAPDGDAGPFVADWDGDGLPDLLVGCGNGGVQWFRNTGTRTAPGLAHGQWLVPPRPGGWGEAPKEPTRGLRAKICVADWNGDGRPDLLLGDYATLKPDLPEPTAEQKAEHERLRKEFEEVKKRYHALAEQVGKAKDSEERGRLEKEQGEIGRQWGEIQGKLPRESEPHGWIWLFLRKPAQTPSTIR